MKAERVQHHTWVGAFLLILLFQAACDNGGASSQSPSAKASRTEESTQAETPTAAGEGNESAGTGPRLCSTDQLSSWTPGRIASRRLVARGDIGDVVVNRSGSATVAWTSSLGYGAVRTADEPIAAGGPLSPAGPPNPQRRSSLDAFGGGAIGIDAADVQTLLWQSDERGPSGGPSPFSEFYDLTVADRRPGGVWGSPPAVVGSGGAWNAQLAVNASGAAIVTWHHYVGRESRVFASYRVTAGAQWTQAELVARNASSWDVGVDDAGRVLLLFSGGKDKRTGLYAARRSPTHGWRKPQRLPGRDISAELAVGEGGSAVVLRSNVSFGPDDEYGSQFTVRMTPSGRWQAPDRHPAPTDAVARSAIDVDAKGRILMSWWDGRDLLIRWSTRDGEWRQPCIIAAAVSKPFSTTLDAQLAVNRRGDALVVWCAKGQQASLWARYKPFGKPWSAPAKVSRANSRPGYYDIALGDAGHAAIAWMPGNGREVHIVRAFPVKAASTSN